MNEPSTGLRTAAILLGVAAVITSVALLVFAVAVASVLAPSRQAAVPRPPTGPDSLAPSFPPPRGDGVPTVEPIPTPPPPSSTGDGRATLDPSYPAPGAEPLAPAGPTARQSATPGPSPTPDGRASLVVEDWTAYRDRGELEDAFGTNVGWAANTIGFEILVAAESPHGPAGVAVAYDIAAEAPNDYVGFERDLEAVQDWTGYSALVVWVQPDEVSDRQLVVQWHERSGEVWRHRTRLSDVPADGRVAIPLAPAAWEWADWSDYRNGALDLDIVSHIGIFVGHTGPGAGTLRLGTLEVVGAGVP